MCGSSSCSGLWTQESVERAAVSYSPDSLYIALRSCFWLLLPHNHDDSVASNPFGRSRKLHQLPNSLFLASKPSLLPLGRCQPCVRLGDFALGRCFDQMQMASIRNSSSLPRDRISVMQILPNYEPLVIDLDNIFRLRFT